MRLKQWVLRLAPPVLVDLYRRLRRRPAAAAPIWQGIHRAHRDVPRSGAGYGDPGLVQETLAHTEGVIAGTRRYGTIPTAVTGEHTLLPLLASVLCKGSGRVRVLDFGGGMGVAYVHLVSSVPSCGVIDYHIVEHEAVCEAGARLFESDPRVHFHASLPDDLPALDVVHVSSALQYVENYVGLLARLCAYGSTYVLFVKLSAGDIPTYATAQTNLPGMTVPYWFIDVKEIVRLMSLGGYSLIFKGALEREYRQDNFPAEYRLGRACNLLFARA